VIITSIPGFQAQKKCLLSFECFSKYNFVLFIPIILTQMLLLRHKYYRIKLCTISNPFANTIFELSQAISWWPWGGIVGNNNNNKNFEKQTPALLNPWTGLTLCQPTFGRSLLCTTEWCSNASFLLKAFGQMEQRNGASPVCMRSWIWMTNSDGQRPVFLKNP
jgi:hypothetical protein